MSNDTQMEQDIFIPAIRIIVDNMLDVELKNSTFYDNHRERYDNLCNLREDIVNSFNFILTNKDNRRKEMPEKTR